MSQDPYGGDIRNPASLHRYRYASGNPVNRIDPSGRDDTTEMALGISWTAIQGYAAIYALGKSINCIYESEASAVRVLNGPQTGAAFEQLLSLRLDEGTCAASAVFSGFALGGMAYGGLQSLLADTEPFALCCFAAGTMVHTDHGDVPIERIRVGDMVLSRSRTTGEQEYKRVTALTAQHRDKLIELRVEGEPEPLRPAVDHPLWVLRAPSQQPAWIVADSMRAGDLVLDLKGEWHKVVSVKPLEGLQTVYNFEVDDNHDYFVGTTGFLVHNDLCLFKWDPEAGAPIDKGVPIKEGDYHLYLPWLGEGADAAQIQQNVNALLNVMAEGNPISETYIDQWTGKLLGVAPSAQDAGYLEAVERQLLEWNGWTYNPGYGEWFPPGWFGD